MEQEYIKIEQDMMNYQENEPQQDEEEEFKEEKLSIKVENEDGEDLKFENELLKLEKEIETVDPEFERQVTKMTHMVNEQAEESSTLRQVVESLSERLAQSQLENDNLNQKINAAKRKQELRQLYMKMTYSNIPKYQNLKRIQNNNNNVEEEDDEYENDQTTMMDLDKAIDIIINKENYIPSQIMNASKAIYGHGLTDDQSRAILTDKHIIKPLLDIIQYNGKLIKQNNPDAIDLVTNAIKAIIPLLGDKKIIDEFLELNGIGTYNDLIKPENLKQIAPICSLIAESIKKVMDFAETEDQKAKLDDIIVKLCNIAKANIDDLELLHEFGEILKKVDLLSSDPTPHLMKPLIDNGLLDTSVSCALVKKDDYIGVCDTFGFTHDHVGDVKSVNGKNIDIPNIKNLVDFVDLYAPEAVADVLTNVLDGMLAIIEADKLPKEILQEFIDNGLEKALIKAIDKNKSLSNNIDSDEEEKYGSETDIMLKWGNDNSDEDKKKIIDCIADFYNTLEFDKLNPKMSQLKAKLNEMDIGIYGTDKWLDQQDPNGSYKKLARVKTPDSDDQVLEDLYAESKYQFDEQDAMQLIKQRRDERVKHANLADIGSFLSRMGKPEKTKKEFLEKQKFGMMRKTPKNNYKQEMKVNNQDNNNQQESQSKMSKLFSGMFKKKMNNNDNDKNNVNNKNNKKKGKNEASNLSVVKLKKDDTKMPNRLKQQERLFINNKKRIKYDDFMNEAFDNKLVGNGADNDLNELQKIYNEMDHYTQLVRPVGAMLQKWYVLANHLTTYWISPTNRELSRWDEKEEEEMDLDVLANMSEQERYYDCWILYDMKRKRMLQEIRWRNRGMMNDPKYITVQCANSEETPWSTVIDHGYLENNDKEQKIKINQKARYWRVLCLGNYGEDTDEAPRFVFYEVQFWGKTQNNYRSAPTMQYSKKSNSRRDKYTSVNARHGVTFSDATNNSIRMTGRSGFKTVPSYRE